MPKTWSQSWPIDGMWDTAGGARVKEGLLKKPCVHLLLQVLRPDEVGIWEHRILDSLRLLFPCCGLVWCPQLWGFGKRTNRMSLALGSTVSIRWGYCSSTLAPLSEGLGGCASVSVPCDWTSGLICFYLMMALLGTYGLGHAGSSVRTRQTLSSVKLPFCEE